MPLWADMHSDDEDEGDADEDTTAAAEGDLRMPLWADMHSDDGDSWAHSPSGDEHSDAGSLSEPQEEPAAGANGGANVDTPRSTSPDGRAKPRALGQRRGDWEAPAGAMDAATPEEHAAALSGATFPADERRLPRSVQDCIQRAATVLQAEGPGAVAKARDREAAKWKEWSQGRPAEHPWCGGAIRVDVVRRMAEEYDFPWEGIGDALQEGLPTQGVLWYPMWQAKEHEAPVHKQDLLREYGKGDDEAAPGPTTEQGRRGQAEEQQQPAQWTELWQGVKERVDARKWDGPYLTEQAVRERVGSAFLAAPTFPVDGKGKVRAVCDYSASGHNSGVTVATPETLETLDDAMEAAIAWKTALRGDGTGAAAPPEEVSLAFGKIDLKSAYEQVPARKQDEWASVAQVRRTADAERLFPCLDWSQAGDKVWFVTKRQTFGMVAAGTNFAVVGNLVCHVARAALVPLQAFRDDFWHVGPACVAGSAHDTVRELLAALGLEWRPEKDTPPAGGGELLGTWVQMDTEPMSIACLERRKIDLTKQIDEVLQADTLTPAGASKMAGRLGFAATALYGRVGRGFLHPLFRHQRGTRKAIGGRLARALGWWKTALWRMAPRLVPATGAEAHVVVYTDACETDQLWGVGAVARYPDGSEHRFFWSLPQQQTKEWMEQRQRYIAALEAVAVWSAMHVWGHAWQGRRVLWAIDNVATLGSFIRGYSQRGDVCRLAEDFWGLAAETAVAPWLVFVPSSLNLADRPSRGGAPPLAPGLRARALQALRDVLRGGQ